jgi:hypothetical protein
LQETCHLRHRWGRARALLRLAVLLHAGHRRYGWLQLCSGYHAARQLVDMLQAGIVKYVIIQK